MAYANSADPDQTAPSGAVWSGSTLFAIILGILIKWKKKQKKKKQKKTKQKKNKHKKQNFDQKGMKTSQKHAYIILNPLNPTFV